MSFEKEIVGSIPLHEAARFFLKLKTASNEAGAPMVGPQGANPAEATTNGAQSTSYAPPDETGALEGQFAVPVEHVLKQMAEMVVNEFKTMYAYRVYSQSMRDLSNFSIADEFEEHSEDELEHAEFLLRRMAVLGGPIDVGDIPSPPASSDPVQIIQTMVRMEQEGLARWKQLHAMMGENPSRFKIEEYMTKEQEHLDQLWQLLPSTANTPVLQSAGALAPAVPQDANPSVNNADVSGMSPPAATEKKAAVIERFHPDTLRYHGDAMRTALMHGNLRGNTILANIGLDGEKIASVSRVQKQRVEGNFDNVGELSARLAEFAKTAGIGGSVDWRPMAPMPMTVGDPMAQMQQNQPLQVTMPVIGDYPGKRQPAADVVAPRRARGGGGGGGDDMGMGGLDFGKEGSKAGSEQHEKGKQRAEANIAARAHQTKGMRGELFGDVIGRLLGGSGGFYAGKAGGSLPAMAGAALGQHVGSRAGKVLGRELDTRRHLAKHAFDDTTNFLSQEQALEEAQVANEARFYQEQAQQAQQAKAQMEQALQQAQAQAEQQKAQLEQLHMTVEQQSQMANDATTKALMQSVEANNAALQSRQVANDTSNAFMQFKQKLREMVDGSVEAPSADGPSNLQGPANQAASPGSPQIAAPPEGEQTTPAPQQSPANGSMGSDAAPSSNISQREQPKTAGALDVASRLAKQVAPKVPYALAGAGFMGGLQHLSNQQGSDDLRNDVEEQEAKGPTGSFADALRLAQRKARLALAEAGEAHPVASTAAAALGGASLGATLGPGLSGKLMRAPQDIKTVLGG